MAIPRSVSETPEPPALHARAMDNLEFIRETMEQASSFTAVSGWGQVAIRASALAAAWVASAQSTPRAWLFVWLGEAVLAAAVSGGAMALKARRQRTPVVTGPMRKFVLAFSPPMFFGVLL